MTIKKTIRGVRDTIPAGYFLGRPAGSAGPATLLPLSMFTTPGYVANTTVQIGQAAGGDLSGTYPNPTVKAIQGNAVKSGALGGGDDGKVLTWVNANSDWEAKALPTTHSIPAGGTTGQALEKNSNTDYDVSWVTPSSSSGGGASSVKDDGTNLYFALMDSNGQLVLDSHSNPIFGIEVLPSTALPNVIAAAGPVGDGTHVAAITYDAHGRLTTVSSVAITPTTLPTRQVLLSGTGATYTTPANCRMIVVRMRGGGGAGGGSSDTVSKKGADGNDTIFNSIHAAGGKASNGTAVAPGGHGGIGTASFREDGSPGANIILVPVSTTNWAISGGAGGGHGGGPGGAGGNPGTAASANSGGGGGSGGVASDVIANINTANFFMYGGGGEGEYVELIIANPAGTYTYTVAAASTGGDAGGSGFAGGNGGDGWIIVDEYY